MSEWRDASLGGKLKLVVFSLLPALLLLSAAQLYAIARIDRDAQIVKHPVTGKPYLYTMEFGWGFLSSRTQTPLNSLGFPDREFSDVAPKGDCVHVVVAGDSFTFGDAVDRHRNWVSLVASSVSQSAEGCIRFFNLGQRMTTVEEQAKHIEQTFPLLEPDVVILGQYQNDITDLTNPGNAAFVPAAPGEADNENWWGDVVRTRVPLSNAAIVRYLSYRAFAFMITRGIRYDVLHQWSVLADSSRQELAEKLTSIYRDLYLALASGLARRGVEFGTVIMPSKLDLLAGHSPEETFFVELAEEATVPYVTTYSALDQSRDQYPYQMFDGHLSEAGNLVVARVVLDWLLEAEPAPFRALRDH